MYCSFQFNQPHVDCTLKLIVADVALISDTTGASGIGALLGLSKSLQDTNENAPAKNANSIWLIFFICVPPMF